MFTFLQGSQISGGIHMKFKRFLSMLLCLCLVSALFTGFVGTASADDNVITHTVANGEYLFKICKIHGLDYYQCKNAIMQLNGFKSEAQMNNLSVGQQLKLPASNALAASVTASTTTSVSTSTTVGGVTTTTIVTSSAAGTTGVATAASASFYLASYVVKSGDTLNKICNSLGTNYYTYSSMILAMNGIKNETSIWAGKTLLIPVSTAPASGYAVIAHTV